MPQHHFEPPRGRLLEIELESPALGANLLGDPSTRRVALYLPEGYDGGQESYPLLVHLDGYTGSGLRLVGWKAFGESVPQRIDRLIAAGAMGPVIVAFPDCFTSLGGNQYIDSLAMGRWATFLVEELVPAIERGYRVRPGRGKRGLFGKSSGGYGALVHGMLHASTWGAVACHSGDMDFDLVYRTHFPATLQAIAKRGGSIASFLEHVSQVKRLASADFHALMTLGMAATYDPDPEAPMGVRLPVDLHTCALDPVAWERWLAHDPLRLIEDPSCQERLRGLAALYIDVGAQDQYAIQYGTRRLVARLGELGIDHRYDEFEGTHSGVEHRLDDSLPFLYRALTGGD